MSKKTNAYDNTQSAIPNTSPWDILNKEKSVRLYIETMLNRTNLMFKWNGLPETCPEWYVELMLQARGILGFVNYTGETSTWPAGIYPVIGNIGGEPTPYLSVQKRFIGANAALNFSYDQVIDEECVVAWNDTCRIGLLPLFRRYSTQMAENDVSIRSAQINSRQETIISAASERDAASANIYMENLVKGTLSTIVETPFLESLTVHNAGTAKANTIIQLIELQQYLKSSWFNEIGLNTSFSMKREYVSAEEIGAMTDTQLPLVDDMLRQRERACDSLNKVFGLNVTVERNSAWENKYKEAQKSIGELGGEEGESTKPGQTDVAGGNE